MADSPPQGGVARREAQPLAWPELTREQQAAATQACSILGELAEQGWKVTGDDRSGLRRFLPRIDKERLNHVVLLDGGRGSGKTALLITLLDAWSRRVLQEDGARRSAPEADAAPPQAFEKLLTLTDRVVPVGLVDLQPLPPSTHLMMHLVSQFLPLVEAIEDDQSGFGERTRRAPWHDTDSDESKSTKVWRAFLRAAAAGSDGGITERRAKLDPEAYALELEHAERRRLDVRACFRALIDALVEEYQALARWPAGKVPLFVVPVDDADMNPTRAVELLDLVRTLWHPRVAFLMTGESEMFLTVLRAHALRALRAPLGAGTLLVKEERDLLHYADQPKTLASEIYDKAIPSGHRCQLPEVSPEARLDVLRREQVLRRVKGPAHPLHLESLEEYFTLQAQACGALPARLRPLMDLATRIQRALGNIGQYPSDSRVDARYANPSEILASLHTGYEDLANGSDEQRRIVVLDLLRAHAMGSPEHTWAPGRAHTVRLPLRGPLGITFQHRFTVDEALSPAAAHIFTAFDAIGGLSADTTGSLQGSNFGLRGFIVRTAFESDELGSVFSFAWPLPDWDTFLDYAAFSYVWNRVAGLSRDLGGGRKDLAVIETRAKSLVAGLGATARSFIATVLRYVKPRRARSQMAVDASLGSAIDALNQLAEEIRSGTWTWPELARETAKLALDDEKTVKRSPDQLWALVRAGLLAAPESGLDLREANEWLTSLRQAFGPTWFAIAKALRGQQQSHRAPRRRS
jgi:hypothetical protein